MILGFEGVPTQEIIKACKERSITLNVDGDRYVGAFIGRNKELQEEFVLKQLERHRPVFEALSQPGMSTQIAMILLRTRHDTPLPHHDHRRHTQRGRTV